MKRILFVSMFLLWSVACGPWTNAGAAIPRLINYQGKVTDSSNVPLTGSYAVAFRIYDAESGGNMLWEENHSGVVVDKGLFNVLLGSVTGLDIPFDKPYFLEIKVGNEVMSPRQQITASAYAMRAGKAESLTTAAQQGDILYFDGSNWIGLAAGTRGQFLKTNGLGANPSWANGNLTFLPGSVIFARSDSESAKGYGGTYEKIKEILVGTNGTISVDFDMCDAGAFSSSACGRIYVNGVPIGIEQMTKSNSYITYTENINVKEGDLVQLYGHSGAGNATYASRYRNFRLKTSQFFGGYVTFSKDNLLQF